MSQAEFLRRIVEILERNDIPYMIVGSLASALHGTPRATQDVDIVIDPTASSLSKLLSDLSPGRYYVDAETARDALSRRNQFNVIDLDTGWKADLVVRKRRAFSVEELRRRATARIQGVDLDVASAEDTILSKLEWASKGESERQLRDAVGVIAVQGDSLNYEYIERWAGELGVVDLWRRAAELARDT